MNANIEKNNHCDLGEQITVEQILDIVKESNVKNEEGNTFRQHFINENINSIPILNIDYTIKKITNKSSNIVNQNFLDYSNSIDYKGLLITEETLLRERIYILEGILDELEIKMNTGIVTEETQTNIIHCIRILTLNNKEKYSHLIKKMQRLLSKIRKKDTANIQTIEFDDIFQNLDESQYRAYGKTISIIQLTTGCTIGCPDCNFNAIKNVRSQLSFDAISKICDIFGENLKLNEVFLYYATDPLDWEDDEGRNYMDIQNLVYSKVGYYPWVTTAIPKGKEELARELWKTPVNMRISLTHMNKRRLGIENQDQAEEYFGQPGNKKSFFYFNEFYIDVKSYNYTDDTPSIGCRNGGLITPEGAFSMVSTNTSPSNPNGYKKYNIDRKTKIFIDHDFTHDSQVKDSQTEVGFINIDNELLFKGHVDVNFYYMFKEFYLPVSKYTFIFEGQEIEICFSKSSNSTIFNSLGGNRYHQEIDVCEILEHIEGYRKYLDKNELERKLLANEYKDSKEDIVEISLKELLISKERGGLEYYNLSCRYIKQEMIKLLFPKNQIEKYYGKGYGINNVETTPEENPLNNMQRERGDYRNMG